MIKAGVTGVLLGALLLTIDVHEVIRAIRGIPPGMLALVLVLLVADRVLMGLKWRQLVNGAGRRLRMRDAVGIYFQSGFAALLLPTSMGGEVLRGILGPRAGVPLQLLLPSMVMEKLIAGVSNVTLAVIGAAYVVRATEGEDALVALAVGGSALVILATLVAAVNRRFHEWIGRWARHWIPERGFKTLDRFSAGVVGYRQRKDVLRTNLLLNLAEHLLQFSALYLLALGLGIDFGLLPFFAVTAVVMLVRRMVGFLESWWLAETAVVVLYHLFGVPQALSVGLAFALWGTSIVAALPGAYLLYRHGLDLGDWWSRRLELRRGGEPDLSRISSPYS
ncbi:MAG TPA: lysylphosphatidylglycerol synthase transmembrane domain-containing protein [Gemmatimonadales bacterium]|nr:lysylphosphatidylglycerol synthase transmembrane domain-containing protein [Gemmatimonadales bacterium]